MDLDRQGWGGGIPNALTDEQRRQVLAFLDSL